MVKFIGTLLVSSKSTVEFFILISCFINRKAKRLCEISVIMSRAAATYRFYKSPLTTFERVHSFVLFRHRWEISLSISLSPEDHFWQSPIWPKHKDQSEDKNKYRKPGSHKCEPWEPRHCVRPPYYQALRDFQRLAIQLIAFVVLH